MNTAEQQFPVTPYSLLEDGLGSFLLFPTSSPAMGQVTGSTCTFREGKPGQAWGAEGTHPGEILAESNLSSPAQGQMPRQGHTFCTVELLPASTSPVVQQ